MLTLHQLFVIARTAQHDGFILFEHIMSVEHLMLPVRIPDVNQCFFSTTKTPALLYLLPINHNS